MKSLNTYLNDFIDGHIHLFDIDGCIEQNNISSKSVCFGDILWDRLDEYCENFEFIYDKWIEEHYNKDNHILLATGVNSEQIINIYEKHPNIIKGFGELKCYRIYKDRYIYKDNLSWIIPLLEYNKELKLPVYIHYDINDSNKEQFEYLLKTYPEIPIVLCHMGMAKDKFYKTSNWSKYDTFIYMNKLLNKYDNLYADISWECTKFVYKNNLIDKINKNKCIFGLDLTPQTYRVKKDAEELEDFYIKMYKYFMNYYNKSNKQIIGKLFK